MRPLTLLVLILCPVFCLADTIVFKNGRELAGKILEQDETTILLEVEYGTMRVPKSLVERIDPDTPEAIAKREAFRKAREEAAAKRAAEREFESQFKQAAKPKKAPAKAVAAKAKNNQQQNSQQQNNQPRWSDQYIQWRRTRRTGQTGQDGYTRTSNSRNSRNSGNSRMSRNPFTGNNSASRNGAGRARLPFSVNQLPNGLQDMGRKYLGGRGR